MWNMYAMEKTANQQWVDSNLSLPNHTAMQRIMLEINFSMAIIANCDRIDITWNLFTFFLSSKRHYNLLSWIFCIYVVMHPIQFLCIWDLTVVTRSLIYLLARLFLISQQCCGCWCDNISFCGDIFILEPYYFGVKSFFLGSKNNTVWP